MDNVHNFPDDLLFALELVESLENVHVLNHLSNNPREIVSVVSIYFIDPDRVEEL